MTQIGLILLAVGVLCVVVAVGIGFALNAGASSRLGPLELGIMSSFIGIPLVVVGLVLATVGRRNQKRTAVQPSGNRKNPAH